MMNLDPNTMKQMLKAMLLPLQEAVANPKEAQRNVLNRLVADFAKTNYGLEHGADKIETIADYRRAFPVTNYDRDYKPLIERVIAGDRDLLLWEDPIGWAITRGTTKGESKYIPMTPTDMALRINAGRAMINYVLTSERFDLFDGVNLNLNFPSVVGTLSIGDKYIEYGYSSGIYTKYVSQMTPIRSVPSQEQIDSLGGGKSVKDWEKRFELAYELCKGENVSLVGGVCPTAIRFGKYIQKTHNEYPKDLWQTQIMTLGSVPGINTSYQPSLKAMYGTAIIREIYGATEGMFGQQMDEKRAWVPNYDLFFFEVATRSGIKMLYEMQPGEMGSLIVSTPVLARYRIGDLIRAYEPPYFRCIGRDEWYTPLRHFWNEFMSFNLDQL
jgi:hypothetical protein